LRDLHAVDPHPNTNHTPNDPLWVFSFDECEMFVVGMSPTCHLRRSRNLGRSMILVFRPRLLFKDPITGQPIPMTTRRALHSRMLAYDNMVIHPDIGLYGDAANREWKQ
jgi:uncharacterized protein